MTHTHKHEGKVWVPGPLQQAAVERSTAELRTSDEEFEKAFTILKKYPKRITFFGSARLLPTDPYYQKARDLAAQMSHEGFAVLTGGAGGIMEASNRGAQEANGTSIGFNIALPHEQLLNPYTTDNLLFHFFFTRKVMMTFYSHAFICFPGGFGTLDEFFEVLTLMQTKKMPQVPIILFGNDFWQGLDDFIHKYQLQTNLITAGDEKIYTITEDFDEIKRVILSSYNT
jgi:uncharacterized protein (TIGR00730 family)